MGPAGGNVGIGFAIPVDMIKSLTAQLIEHGEVQRGHLGVFIQDVSEALMEALDDANDSVLLRVIRGQGAAFIVVTR